LELVEAPSIVPHFSSFFPLNHVGLFKELMDHFKQTVLLLLGRAISAVMHMEISDHFTTAQLVTRC